MVVPGHLPKVFPDPFAIEWGHDEYGTFQSFAVGSVVQRMRWIPPGRFIMGSPENEVGRFDNEIQHEVEFANGFWLGETPVTQALWEAVMETNPSHFPGLDYPVESVNWSECQAFTVRLNELVKGINARLPTEEEWEYACRAGTTTSTWVGDRESVEGNFVLWLDEIAWYLANSVYDEAEWKSKQNRTFRQGTHSVKRKAPNPWGLYDMLGNVYEYCSDEHRDYRAKLDKSREMRKLNLSRNVRGGSWRSMLKYVRAANRGSDPGITGANDLGLRIAASSGPTHRRR